MNFLWPRFIRSAYRREPISSFLFIFGSIDAAIGSLGSYHGLTFLGLATLGGSLALRWWQLQRVQKSLQPEKVAQFALPPNSSQPQVPILSIPKKNPPL